MKIGWTCCLTAVFAFTLFMSLSNQAVAQAPAKLPDIIPPSRDASSLGKFGDIPVGPTLAYPRYRYRSIQ